MDNNKNRMKDRPKSKNELRKIDPTSEFPVGSIFLNSFLDLSLKMN